MRLQLFVCCFLFSHLISFGQSDTVLNTVISHPFYYNIIKDKEGVVYSGSAAGMQRWEGQNSSFITDEKGYVELGENGEPLIRLGGIKKHENFKYNHLLPYPNEIRTEFYANTAKNLYIVTGGRLYIFDILPYAITYRNHSIRSISDHYVGTYSGIYHKGKKMAYPPYTEGYIREIGDTAFVYFSNWLYLFYPDPKATSDTAAPAFALKETMGEVFDVIADPKSNKRFYFCDGGLYTSNAAGEERSFLFKHKGSDPLVAVGFFENILQFCSGNEFWTYDLLSGKATLKLSLPDKVMSAVVLNDKFYLLTATELYNETIGGKYTKLGSFTDAHTVLAINDKELVVATNMGLYRINIETRETKVIIQGVEFNRRALYLKDKILYAGTINGLYQINVEQVDAIIQNNMLAHRKTVFNQQWLILAAVLVLIIVVLVLFLINTRRKLKKIQLLDSAEKPVKDVTAGDIVTYIKENLTTVSIKSINEHFNTNTVQLYNILKPRKPGNIITDLRTEIVLQLRKEGKSAKEIAESTGFSESYIYRVKQK